MTFVLFGLLSRLALFGKKRSYKERKSRPSGSAPPAQQTSPRAETSSGVSRPGTSSASSSRPLGGQGKPGGSQGAPGVVSGGLPPLPLGLGLARGVGVPPGMCLAWAGSLPPLLRLRAVEVWKLPALDRLPVPASPSLWTPPHSHRTFHDVRM